MKSHWLSRQSPEIKEKYRLQRIEAYKKVRHLVAEKRRLKKLAMSPEELEEYRRGMRERGRQRDLKIFGLTTAQYDEMFAAQHGLCKICKKPETVLNNKRNRVRRLQVDHNHKTGMVRKLLCHRCNVAIGLFLESPELLEEAANYLRSFLAK